MPITKMSGKKNGLQQYRVRVNYTDPDGKYKRIERTVYGKAEAQAVEAEILQKISNPEPKSMTFSDFFEKYKQHQQFSVRETTYDKMLRVSNTHILPYIGEVKLPNLTQQRLEDWKTEIASKDMTAQTKNKIYSILCAALNYAVKLKYIQSNPLKEIGRFKDVYFEMPEDKIQYYTADQFLKFIEQVRPKCKTMTQWGTFVFFCIAFYTGMRKGEINALKWSDIDGNIISVKRSVSQKIKGKKFVESPPKNKSSYRKIQIPKPLAEALEEHKSRQQKDTRWNTDYRVCGGISVIPDTTIEKANKTASEAAKLPHIRIHDFRHTHASLLINEGISIQEVARRLGHSDVKMTWNVYGHLYPKEEERAVEILNRIK